MLSLLSWRNLSKQIAHSTFTKSMTKMLSLHIELHIQGASKSRELNIIPYTRRHRLQP